ncbi:iron-containing alcohol dehydrogenase [Bacillus sp. Marseille-P3661]|uniref:iron-containing alcohol dehydrogenase n=1 Tax=Bacillus sp. Marseille-P3661 TaxID=1936234 RepID=UPI000C8469C6|nr:iron-containing alcohol dehydrogenase [Bacillus sp. Marseille-P3661]
MGNNLTFNYTCPTDIHFGPGVIKEIVDIIEQQQPKHLLIVCDEGVSKAGILDKVIDQIATVEISYTVFSDVEANPSVETVNAGRQLFEESGADFIIAVGGGSPMDVGKAIAILATNGGGIIDYEGLNKVSIPAAPLIAIPTTSGTASEVTAFTIITDLKRMYKASIGGQYVAPKWAIVDPLLTVSLPPMLTASTGMDALVHAIESYVSRWANPISDVLALEAIRKISYSLRDAVYNGNNVEARSDMMLGSMLAGMAFTHTRLGNVHAMSHPLSAHFNVPHGIANSILLPHVMEFNRVAALKKFKEIAIAMGEENLTQASDEVGARKAVEAVRSLSKDIGIPETFKDFGVKEELLPELVAGALLSGNVLVNPRSTDAKDVETIYRLAF